MLGSQNLRRGCQQLMKRKKIYMYMRKRNVRGDFQKPGKHKTHGFTQYYQWMIIEIKLFPTCIAKRVKKITVTQEADQQVSCNSQEEGEIEVEDELFEVFDI